MLAGGSVTAYKGVSGAGTVSDRSNETDAGPPDDEGTQMAGSVDTEPADGTERVGPSEPSGGSSPGSPAPDAGGTGAVARPTDPHPEPPTAVIGAQPAVASPALHAPQPSRKARVVVRKVGPWSVLKFSLLFYLCVMLVVVLAGTMLYLALDALGTIDAAVELAVNLSIVESGFEVNGNWLFWRAITIGLVGVVLWSLVNVFVTFLYNLISDVVGGVEITLGEKRSRRG